MTDARGTRAVFSVVLPATNAVTEPDLADLRPPGVTNQTVRFPFPGRPESLDELFDLMAPCLALARACEPDRVIVGFSSEFMDDPLGVADGLRARCEETLGIATTMAGDAVPAALSALGTQRIAVLTPYPEAANRNVEAYFAGRGFAVAAVTGIAQMKEGRIDTARVVEADVRAAFARLDAPGVEALVQVGTAMACAHFAPDLETVHGKPVVAVNTATYWLALRDHGLETSAPGRGALFAV